MLYLLVSADFHTVPDGTRRNRKGQIKLSDIKCNREFKNEQRSKNNTIMIVKS